MIKTVNIGDKEIRLSNNVSWTIIYRDQFGHDIVSSLTPLLASVVDVATGLIGEFEPGQEVNALDLIKKLDGDALIDAVAHLSGVELVDVINITWAMAKAVDEDIPEPRRWVQQFDEFPLDVVVPEVGKLLFMGLVSRKNLKRLTDLKGQIKMSQPLN